MSVRLIVRTFSELCITVGALIVLFVVYVLFWTGVKAADATEGQIDALHSRWAQGPVSASAPQSSPAPGKPKAPKESPPLPRTGTASRSR